MSAGAFTPDGSPRVALYWLSSHVRDADALAELAERHTGVLRAPRASAPLRDRAADRTRGGVLAVRPDGHVAFHGAPGTGPELRGWLHTTLGLQLKALDAARRPAPRELSGRLR